MPNRTLSAPAPADSLLQTLAAQAAIGNDEAFEALHRRLHGGLQRYLLRQSGGSVELAEELAHATWIEVWRAFQARRYDPERAAVSTYVYGVGQKIWLQHRRRSQGGPRLVDAAEHYLADMIEQLDDPAGLLHFEEMLMAVRACLRDAGTPNSLTDEERRIVEGIAAGESDRSMADKLGVAPSTANTRKNAAYAKLRRCLAAKGFGAIAGERVGRGSE